MIETWELNNHTLEYDDEGHIYIVDGIIVPSVTQILSKHFNDYKGVSPDILERAANKGTALHSAIENYEKTGHTSDLQEFKDYLFLKKIKCFENIANEIPIIFFDGDDCKFAGRLDQVIKINGVYGINDFKRVSAPNREKICYQLNLYRLGYMQTYKKNIEHLSFMQLKDGKRKFVSLPINEELSIKLLDK